MEIRSLGVVGAGTMGGGIAQVAAVSGFQVLLNDVGDEFLNRGISAIERSLDRMIKKGTVEETQKFGILSRIAKTLNIDDLAKADMIIEAAPEDLSLKANLFKQLDRICSPEIVLASNTSSISITLLAASTSKPQRVIGMHFMNPVPVMPLVEVVRGLRTSDNTAKIANEISQRLGKTPIEINDSPGFASNRILMPMINEAIFALYEGVGTVEAIDTVMKLGMNHPMGPLTLADLIGLDTCLSIMNVLYEGFNDSKYRPCPLLKKMVDSGLLGRKSGRGFYNYNE